MQEESIRRNERDRKMASDTATTTERQVTSLEAENRQLQVGSLSQFSLHDWEHNISPVVVKYNYCFYVLFLHMLRINYNYSAMLTTYCWRDKRFDKKNHYSPCLEAQSLQFNFLILNHLFQELEPGDKNYHRERIPPLLENVFGWSINIFIPACRHCLR